MTAPVATRTTVDLQVLHAPAPVLEPVLTVTVTPEPVLAPAPAPASRRRRGARRLLVRAGANLLGLAMLLLAGLVLLPGVLGYERYVITGGSMSGTFERGALVIEQAVPVEQLRVGDVITYLPPASTGLTSLVTHRIVETRTSPEGAALFLTQGDANADPDPWIFQLDGGLQPRMVAHVPLAGHAFIALADREVRMLVIGGPAAVVALLALSELVGPLGLGRRAARRSRG